MKRIVELQAKKFFEDVEGVQILMCPTPQCPYCKCILENKLEDGKIKIEVCPNCYEIECTYKRKK